MSSLALNPGQLRIFDIVVNQRLSVFYGGEAGTGKTHVADAMIAALAEAGVDVCVCASTGQAAQNLDEGFTVHMLFGLRPGARGGPSQRSGTWPMKKALSEAKVIFVDEVSMLNEQLFDDMHARLSRMHGTDKPFGGVQVVALGDFLQLPPVEGRFCFHSSLFRDTFGERCFRLTQQMRQGEDLTYARMLSEIRRGQCLYGAKMRLQARLCTEANAPSAENVTYLYCRRNQVEAKNQACLQALPFDGVEWQARDWTLNPSFVKALDCCVLEQTLMLKTGAPVILRKNVDARRRLVNGSRGKVVGTVTWCELGRATSCADPECAHVELPTKYEVLCDAAPSHFARLPVVEFDGTAYAVGTTTISKHRGNQPQGRKRKEGEGDAPEDGGKKGELVASRIQIPLTLAFALTVHKSQGMTLPKVCFACDNAFDNGQIYVALSRVRRIDDVYLISNYVPVSRIKAASDALEFEDTHVQPLQ